MTTGTRLNRWAALAAVALMAGCAGTKIDDGETGEGDGKFDGPSAANLPEGLLGQTRGTSEITIDVPSLQGKVCVKFVESDRQRRRQGLYGDPVYGLVELADAQGRCPLASRFAWPLLKTVFVNATDLQDVTDPDVLAALRSFHYRTTDYISRSSKKGAHFMMLGGPMTEPQLQGIVVDKLVGDTTCVLYVKSYPDHEGASPVYGFVGPKGEDGKCKRMQRHFARMGQAVWVSVNAAPEFGEDLSFQQTISNRQVLADVSYRNLLGQIDDAPGAGVLGHVLSGEETEGLCILYVKSSSDGSELGLVERADPVTHCEHTAATRFGGDQLVFVYAGALSPFTGTTPVQVQEAGGTLRWLNGPIYDMSIRYDAPVQF